LKFRKYGNSDSINCLSVCYSVNLIHAQTYEGKYLEANYDESKVPEYNKPIIESSIGYHVRSGVHGLELYDWEKYMKFIEYHFLKIPVRNINDVYSTYE